MTDPLSYESAGVNIDTADSAKRAMAESLIPSDSRVLNRLGAFASLYDARFPGYEHPVLVMKTEEPGSKQKLAAQTGRLPSVCIDLIHHLINDIIVMGATPLAVQDAIICGRLDESDVTQMVDSMAKACRRQGCELIGGETSEQPGVLEAGLYILTASVIGVVEKSWIIDGSKVAETDVVLAVASNGLHTNGYSLVRALLDRKPELAESRVGNESFMDAVMRPHRCYFHPLKALFDHPGLHGMAHITGGGIAGNLNRILPDDLDAKIDLSTLQVLPLFQRIQEEAGVSNEEMLRAFNMGVGMVLVVAPEAASEIQDHVTRHGCDCYPIGAITPGLKSVVYEGEVADSKIASLKNPA